MDFYGELKINEIAKFYHELGFNVTQIDGNGTNNESMEDFWKKPVYKAWNYFTIKRMDKFERWWNEYIEITGIGTILGPRLRCIDIDDCIDIEFVQEILNILDLPHNYEWVIRTGSQKGFHLIIECETHNFPVAWGKIKSFASNGIRNFKRLELRWFGHLVLPPSFHKSGFNYEFLSGNFPKKKPKKVNEDKLDFLIRNYCKDDIITGKSGVFLDHGPSYISEEISIINDDLTSYYKDPIKLIYAIKFNDFDKIIMAISWLMMDDNGKIVEYCNYLINPQKFDSIWIPGYYDLSLESNITSTTNHGVCVHEVLIALKNRMEICSEFYILESIEDSKVTCIIINEGDPVTLEEKVQFYYKSLGIGLNKSNFLKSCKLINIIENYKIPTKILCFSEREPLNFAFSKIINFIKAVS